MARSIDHPTAVATISAFLVIAGCSEAPETMPSAEPVFAEEIVNMDNFLFDASPGSRDPAPEVLPEGPSTSDTLDAAVVDCGSEARAAYQIFANRCVICHVSENLGHGGFGGVLSARSMIATGHVVPYMPEQSPVYLRVESGDMPRVGMRLTVVEVGHVEAWIRCGAPPFERERAADAGASEDAGEDGGTDAALPTPEPTA